MKKSVYLRGVAGTCWYNLTEAAACAVLCRPTPRNLNYTHRLPYGSEKKQFINTYCRKDLVNKKKPLLIYVHGGGWVSGISEMRNMYTAKWAQLGFFTATVHYSYAPQKTFPYQFKELFAAIDYIFDHKDEWNIDTGNIIMSGESAGAHFILYAAAMSTDNSLFDKLGIEFRHREEFRLKAVIPHCACYDFDKLLDKSKPQSRYPGVKMMVATYLGMSIKEARKYIKTDEGKLSIPPITEKFPPVFVTWAKRDSLKRESLDLMDSLAKLGVRYGDFMGTGVISNHGWTIVTLFKKCRKGLEKTYDFVLPEFPSYFEKKDGVWQYIG